MVDVIEEGFDAVIFAWASRKRLWLIARDLGHYQLVLVATPGYFAQHGTPQQPQYLNGHACARASGATGKLEPWLLRLGRVLRNRCYVRRWSVPPLSL